MRDLAERLRDLAKYSPVDATADDCHEAAVEIERLRVQRDKWIEWAHVIRTEALEEAASVADVKAEKAGDFAPPIGRAATEIAAAIRALKEKPHDGE